jgi:hypothetical protein
MSDVTGAKPDAMPYSVGQRVSLRISHGDLPEGQIGEVISLEPPDGIWVEFKDVYDDHDIRNAKVRLYATDIQPSAKPKKNR